MKAVYEQTFENYMKNYDKRLKQIKFKYYHSYRVEKLMKILAEMLNFSKEDIELAEVIGLLHDIGRFEQIKKYGDCSDSKTGVDHADESCVYLFDEGHIKEYYDKEENYQIIKDAIRNHNKIVIDPKVKGKNLIFSKMIRDIDKVDIYQVLYENYKYKFDKKEISQKILNIFNKETTMDIHIKKTKSEVVLSYFAFIYDINFKESFIILKKSRTFEMFCSIVTPLKDSIEDFEKYKNIMFSYINRKINE